MGELADAYRALLQKKLNTNSYNYAIYNYTSVDEFKQLWLQNNLIAATAGQLENKALIIIWDGMPQNDGIANLLNPHLTPLDWALAFSIRMLKIGQTDFVPIEIHIIDLSSSQYENAFAMQMAASICDAMPWVKLYSPLPRGRRAYEETFPIEQLQSFTLPNTPIKLPPQNGGAYLNRLIQISKAGKAWIIRSNDHHDLNNIIGPQVILESLMNNPDIPDIVDSKNQLIKIMSTRLKWSELLNSKYPGEQLTSLTFDETTNVISIDDQLERGWDLILCALFGVGYKKSTSTDSTMLKLFTNCSEIALYGSSSPEFLIQQLINIDTFESNKKFSLKPGSFITREAITPQISGIPERPTILILDLYLFTGKSIDETKEYYKTIGATAKLVADLSVKKLAWPNFKEKAMLSELAASGIVNERNIATAITILPRLCALRWPSVPIIVFSSTERREVIEKLINYGNIFLSGSKPNVLTDNSGEHIWACVEKLRRDLLASKGLLKLQKELMNLFQMQSGIVEKTERTKPQHTHITVALDETGNFETSQRSAVGGVMLFTTGTSEADAVKLSFEVQETFRKSGINFFSRAPFYTDANEAGHVLENVSIKKKNESVKEELKKALTPYKETNNVRLSAFCLWIKRENYSTKKTEYKDGAYLQGLEMCIQLIACELLGGPFNDEAGRKGASSSLSWWFPTKATAYATIAKAAEAARRFDFWQVGKNSKGNFIPLKFTQTLGGYGNAYTVLVQSLAGRGILDWILNITKCIKARKIPYNKNEKDNCDLNHHYLCKCGAAPFLKPAVPVNVALKCEAPSNNGEPCIKSLYADYSVLGHLADAALANILHDEGRFPSEQIGKDNLTANLCFEVEDGPELRDFIHVSKLLDEGRPDTAFQLAFRQSPPFFIEGIMKNKDSFAQAHLELHLQKKLRKHALYILGKDIIELSELPRRLTPTKS